ncbi:thiosulfate:glutathione sulfurtransferase [Takifugu flavidus]|uniref:Rhodanese domain-containing protein n=1 Tax=Takifugu flavidus TaxID=433684 RepID=A0A5C6NWK3_9TELE|nr:thiosulfate:glutathione sulfurtransferase [Takifugu flavidus]TWW70961.1 hypothetical protein D4764_17G0004440 [Takifugu flavidus]
MVAVIMLSFILSRTLCQTVAEATCKAHPTLVTTLRTFTTSGPRCGEDSDGASVVTYPQLKTMLSNRDVQLFDVREPEEYQEGRIPDAVNVPLAVVDESMKLSPEQFQQRYNVKAPGKDDNNIVFYCRSGNRSYKALSMAQQLGFTRARHYKGGYSEWAEKEGK